MEENPNTPEKFTETASVEQKSSWQPAGPRVLPVMLALLASCIFFAGISTFVCQWIVQMGGWNENLMAGVLDLNATEPERWQMRLLLGLRHFAAFSLAGFLTIWLFYRGITKPVPGWPDYLMSRRWPSWRMLGLGILLLLVAVPLVLYLMEINKMIPLPESFRIMEAQADDAIKSLLVMDHFSEFVGNMFLIAFLPAIGEEIVFRGVVQQQIMRRIANPWTGLLISAAVFSFFHFQFEGFLSRMLLGFLLGWLYWQTRNFWVPVAAHFFNNGIQVFGQYVAGDRDSVVDLEQDIQIPWFVALLSLFMVVVTMRLIRQQHNVLELHQDDRTPETP